MIAMSRKVLQLLFFWNDNKKQQRRMMKGIKADRSREFATCVMGKAWKSALEYHITD
jgi:hypothetical protein